VRSHASTVEHL